MSERFPVHKKFPLVLRLWQFGQEGGNGPIRSINKLNKLTHVAHATLRSWKESGWLDLDLSVVAKIMKGEIKEEDLVLGENGKIDLQSFESGDFEGDIETAKVDKQIESKKKNEYTDEFLKDILMSEDELAKNIKPDEDVRGRKTPRQVSVKEFPANDLVFHDIRYYEKSAHEYDEKNHNQFMRDQLRRLRKVVDISGSQLESLVEEGRIGSKSAVAALGLVKDGMGLLARFNKELFEEDNTTKLTKDERKARLARQREHTRKAIEQSQHEAAREDEVVATAQSRLSNFRKRAQELGQSPDIDSPDLEE
jgi:hypothetical protein